MDKFMETAFRLAKKAEPYPNPRVGAVLVKNGKIIGRGYHKKAGMAHAEIEAIQKAKQKTGNPHAALGATLYVTLEPCSHTNKRTPPCTQAIISEGIGRVVFAMKDPNPLVDGASELRDAGITVTGPTDERAAKRINKRYLASMAKKPFVAIKMAMSADGKTATSAGDSKWISGKQARECVHRWRAQFDGVMVGAGTVKRDDPRLTAHGKGNDPHRIIVDGRLGISPQAAVLENRDRKTIIATSGAAPAGKIPLIKNAQIVLCGDNDVDLKKLVHGLGAMGIKKILIEGGSELNARAIESGIVDEIYLFVAPKIIGGKKAKGVIGGKGIARITDAKRLRLKKTKMIGEDLLLVYQVSR